LELAPRPLRIDSIDVFTVQCESIAPHAFPPTLKFFFLISIPPPPPALKIHAQFVNLTRTIMLVSRGGSEKFRLVITRGYVSVHLWICVGSLDHVNMSRVDNSMV